MAPAALRRRTALAAGGLLLVAAAPAVLAGTPDRARSGHAAPTPVPASAPAFSRPGTIDNRYLPLTAHRRCELRGLGADGTREKSVRTVLDRTRRFRVGGRRVEAVVIRDDAYANGKLVESTLDYFAQADDSTVYYLGEQVQNLRNGRVVSTEGTWLYGRDTDRMGVAMPAEPRLGQQWRFEDVPGITTESNRVEETGLRTQVGRRVMDDVIRVQEFIQPEGEIEHKLYAAGVGTVAEYEPGGRLAFAGCR